MAADERIADDGFWERNIPRPWPPSIAREIAQHDHGGQEPQPVDLAEMDMETYVRNRDRLGVRDSNGILGSELRPWQRTNTTEWNGR